jgi:hypothetical protein
MYQTASTGQPTAHITKSKGRVKTYGSNQVYLKNGSNFEIELFNPKTQSVLAKIWINDKLISNAGLIIRPGQRAFIERFIDEPKKFVFNTYDVENTAEAKAAIASNGKVRVEFYDEIRAVHSLNGPFTKKSIPSFPPAAPNYPWSTPNQPYYYGCDMNNTPSSQFISSMYVNQSNLNNSTVGLRSTDWESNVKSSATMDWMETGRIEKGEGSAQKFESASGTFEYTSFAAIAWQILPESSKPVEVNEIRNYCTNCGSRQKKSTWKFCPSCGTPINE